MRSRRALVWSTVAVGALETAAGIYLLAAAGPPRIGLFFCVSGVCTGLLAAALRALISPRPDGGDDGNDGGGGPDSEPPWWPDFEHGFRRYVEEGDRRPSRLHISPIASTT
ncbi:MAG: hypothetical protein ACRDLO_13995 [Solirubrobacterales bacterium]